MNNYEVAYYVLIEKIGEYITKKENFKNDLFNLCTKYLFKRDALSQQEKEKLITSLLDDKQYIDLLIK